MNFVNGLDISNLRKSGHLIGRSLLDKCDYYGALDQLTCTYSKFGSNVMLIADIVACYFLLGRFDDAHAISLKLACEIDLAVDLLSENHLIRSRILLAKSFEECGDFRKALSIYEKISSHKGLDCIDGTHLRAKAQALRLFASLDCINDTQRIYSACLFSRNNNSILTIEIEHALILSEIKLFGLPTAFARLANLLESTWVKETDKRLVFFDFCELALVRSNLEFNEFIKSQAFQNILSLISYYQCDNYEKFIFDLLNADRSRLSLTHINSLSKELAPMGIVRILRMSYFAESSETMKRLFLTQLNLVIEALPINSKELVKKSFLPVSTVDEKDLVSLDLNTRKLHCRGQIADVSDRLFLILSSIASLQSLENGNLIVSTMDLIHKAYGLEFSDSSYGRLRKTLIVLDKLILSLTSVAYVTRITKSKITLNVEITSAPLEALQCLN